MKVCVYGGIILYWILEERGARMWLRMRFKAAGLSMVITRTVNVPKKKDFYASRATVGV
jgi:hypothetical protein